MPRKQVVLPKRPPRWVYLVSPTDFVLDPPADIGDDVDVEPLTVDSESWVKWTLMYCKELASSGSEAYARQHQHRVTYFMQSRGLTDFAQVTPEAVLSWKAALQEYGQPRPTDGLQRPCGPSALKTHIAAMKAMHDWLVRVEAIPPRPNPFEKLRTPPRSRAEQRALTSDEIRRLIEYAEMDETGPQRETEPDGTVRYRSSLYRVLGVCGYRIGEATMLRWRHVDLGADPARINLPPTKGKAKDGGTAILPESVRDAMLAYRETVKPEAADLVWPWLSGRAGTVRKVLRRDAKRAGVDERDGRGRLIGWHAFRRGVATELARIGVNPKYAQRILRHRDIRTTLNHYTNADDGKILEAGKALASRHLREPGRGDTGKTPKDCCGGDDEPIDLRSHTRNHEHTRDSAGSHPGVTTQGGRDRMDVGGRSAHPEPMRASAGRRDTGSSPVSPISTQIARLIGVAIDLLSMASELAERSPRKGTDDERCNDDNRDDRPRDVVGADAADANQRG